MRSNCTKRIDYCLSKHKNYIPLLLLLFTSCAKEVYTHEDATNAKREAQKVGLTVMIRGTHSSDSDMSGFTVTTSQCGEDIESVTSADGTANLMLMKGDAVLRLKKKGYATATAIITVNTTGTDRRNTVVVIPALADGQNSGSLEGTVSLQTASSTEEPLVGALVSIHIDMDELIQLVFPGISANYRPGALTYYSDSLMQPVRTGASGTFRMFIPNTVANLTYTLDVHEIELSRRTYCSANQTVVTNGQNHQTVSFRLTPCEN